MAQPPQLPCIQRWASQETPASGPIALRQAESATQDPTCRPQRPVQARPVRPQILHATHPLPLWSLLRHFLLLALTVSALTLSVLQPTPKARLVPST